MTCETTTRVANSTSALLPSPPTSSKRERARVTYLVDDSEHQMLIQPLILHDRKQPLCSPPRIRSSNHIARHIYRPPLAQHATNQQFTPGEGNTSARERADVPGIKLVIFLPASNFVFRLCSSVLGIEGGRLIPPGQRVSEKEVMYLRIEVGPVRVWKTSRSFLSGAEEARAGL